jgi:hypothetical protein
MEKLSGQCGRLKCCLNYELDQYVEAIDTFPKAKVVKIETTNGVAYARKTDILKRLIWFSYEDSQTWVALEVDKVNSCMEENKQGVKVAPLQDLAPASAVLENVGKPVVEDSVDFIGNDELLKRDDEFRTDRLGNGGQKNPRNNRNDNRRDFNQNRDNRRENRPGDRPYQGDRPNNQGERPNRDNRPRNPENNDGRRPYPENRDRNNPRPVDRNRPNTQQRDSSQSNSPQNHRPKPNPNRSGNFRNNPNRGGSEGGNNATPPENKE